MARVVQGTPRLSLPSGWGPLILASGSPRRADLLAAAGWTFDVAPVPIDEDRRPGEAPLACCERLAREKAAAGARGRERGLVLGGDTIVVVDGDILGKPVDRADAAAMLRRLAGRRHEVASSVALQLAPDGRVVSDLALSEVVFEPLDEAALDAYLATGEWADKAGAYAIQGHAAAFAHLVQGRLDTVIGLPVPLVAELVDRLTGELSS